MSTLGSAVGVVRLLKTLKIFELLKPELRQISSNSLNHVKRSFCRPKHWITMTREMIGLDTSARQLCVAKDFGDLPIVSIKSDSFFKPSLLTFFTPLKQINRLRDEMHEALSQLSSNFTQVEARKSGHFVWVDEPHLMIEAVEKVMANIEAIAESNKRQD